jgi:hypothetical protein
MRFGFQLRQSADDGSVPWKNSSSFCEAASALLA